MAAGDSRKKKGVYWSQEPERVLGWALFISALLEWTKHANTCRRWAASGIKSPCLSGLISALLLLLMEYDCRLYLLSNYCGMTNHPSVPGAALNALIRPPAGWNWRTISVPRQRRNNAAKKRFGRFFSELFCYERNTINPDVQRYWVPDVRCSYCIGTVVAYLGDAGLFVWVFLKCRQSVSQSGLYPSILLSTESILSHLQAHECSGIRPYSKKRLLLPCLRAALVHIQITATERSLYGRFLLLLLLCKIAVISPISCTLVVTFCPTFA